MHDCMTYQIFHFGTVPFALLELIVIPNIARKMGANVGVEFAERQRSRHEVSKVKLRIIFEFIGAEPDIEKVLPDGLVLNTQILFFKKPQSLCFKTCAFDPKLDERTTIFTGNSAV